MDFEFALPLFNPVGFFVMEHAGTAYRHLFQVMKKKIITFYNIIQFLNVI